MDSNGWLDQVRQAHGLTSDYQLSKLLAVGSSRIGNYRSGRSEFDEDMASRVGQALGVHPAHVLATVRAGKARTDKAREVWESIAKQFGQVACLVAAVLLLMAAPDWSGDALACVDITAGNNPSIHYRPCMVPLWKAQAAILLALAVVAHSLHDAWHAYQDRARYA
jgi:hypothetical protein